MINRHSRLHTKFINYRDKLPRQMRWGNEYKPSE